MTAEAQANANRENAKKWTGPKTPAGKARSALNALKHGLRSKVILERGSEVTGETPDDFADLLADLVAELKPVGTFEAFCVDTMAAAMWRLRLVVHKEYDIRFWTLNDLDPPRAHHRQVLRFPRLQERTLPSWRPLRAQRPRPLRVQPPPPVRPRLRPAPAAPGQAPEVALGTRLLQRRP